MLTNFRTVVTSINRLKEIDKGDEEFDGVQLATLHASRNNFV